MPRKGREPVPYELLCEERNKFILPEDEWEWKPCQGCIHREGSEHSKTRPQLFSLGKKNAKKEETRAKEKPIPHANCDYCVYLGTKKIITRRKQRNEVTALNTQDMRVPPNACSCGNLYEDFQENWYTSYTPGGTLIYRKSCPPCIRRRADQRQAQIARAEQCGYDRNLCLGCNKEKPMAVFLRKNFYRQKIKDIFDHNPFESLEEDDLKLQKEIRLAKAHRCMSVRERFSTCEDCRGRNKECWEQFAQKLRSEKDNRLSEDPNNGDCIGPTPFEGTFFNENVLPLRPFSGTEDNEDNDEPPHLQRREEGSAMPAPAESQASARAGLGSKAHDDDAVSDEKKYRRPCISKIKTVYEQGNIDLTPYLCCLDWDHRIPGLKDRLIGRIRQDYLRHDEQKKCDLRCTFCHRDKTHRKREHGGKVDPEWYKANPTKHQTDKRNIYLKTGCVGPNPVVDEQGNVLKTTADTDKATKCLVEPQLGAFFYSATGRAWYNCVELDHRDRKSKSGNVSDMNQSDQKAEMRKCDLRCTICHRQKGWICGDWGYIFGGNEADPNAPGQNSGYDESDDDGDDGGRGDNDDGEGGDDSEKKPAAKKAKIQTSMESFFLKK